MIIVKFCIIKFLPLLYVSVNKKFKEIVCLEIKGRVTFYSSKVKRNIHILLRGIGKRDIFLMENVYILNQNKPGEIFRFFL